MQLHKFYQKNCLILVTHKTNKLLELDKNLLIKMSISTLVGFSVVGLAIIYGFQENSVQSVLMGGEPYIWQLLYGLTYGVIASLVALTVIRLELLEPVSSFYSKLFENIDLSFEDIVFFSFCAGVGEEIFFRAAVQPFLGVWLTAILFIALHGYLNPQNWRLMIYGLLMVIITAGMGYLFIHLGLLAAISSHFIFDVVMFSYLVFYKKKA